MFKTSCTTFQDCSPVIMASNSILLVQERIKNTQSPTVHSARITASNSIFLSTFLINRQLYFELNQFCIQKTFYISSTLSRFLYGATAIGTNLRPIGFPLNSVENRSTSKDGPINNAGVRTFESRI